jgi:hypothetical protein
VLDDISDGLVLEDVDGLDPVKATIVSSSFAQLDGSQYHSSRREARNVTMKLGLKPDYVNTRVRDLRTKLYSWFMPKMPVSLRFIDDSGLQVDIAGRVESMVAPLFSKEPEANISILCFDPDFIDLTPVTLTGNSVADTGTVTPPVQVTYAGTVEAGMLFTMNINRTLTQFTLYLRGQDGNLQIMDFAYSFQAGDVLQVNTIVGNKFVTLTRAGTTSSILYAVSPQSAWLTLQPGDNYLRVYAVGAAIPYSVAYDNRYGGL